MPTPTRQVLLVARPTGGTPKESDFRLVETTLADPAEGEVLVENVWLSLDPYMRSRMNEAKSYAASVPIGGVMVGGTVGRVVVSRAEGFAPGDVVVTAIGWAEHGIAKGTTLRKLGAPRVPLSAYLGAVGMPGVTAWYGLFEIGKPKAGETVVVGAAAGAVGAVVGQLAKARGCRVVGLAGGEEKCRHVVDTLGFDLCLDHRDPALRERLRDATPNGIDVYFENVGGPVLDLVLARVNPFARIPLCGLVSQYNATEPYGVKNFAALLMNRVTLQGFIISDHLDVWPKALAELEELVARGELRLYETIAEGLQSAPAAFLGMLEGKNLGKQLVRLRAAAG